MNFSINLDFLYPGRPVLESVRAIQEAGFQRVEVCFMEGKSYEELARVRAETGIGIELFLSDFIDCNDPAQQDRFTAAVTEKLAQAVRLDCRKIILAVGDDLAGRGVARERQLAAIEDCARALLPVFRESGAVMLIEPINNKVDHMGCGLWSSAEGLGIVRRLDSPHVRLLYDIYHMQVMEGNVTRTILDNLDVIGHLHCAGSPGRCEPFLGELNYLNILRAVKAAGYQGCVGVEYNPTLPPDQALRRLRREWAEVID